MTAVRTILMAFLLTTLSTTSGCVDPQMFSNNESAEKLAQPAEVDDRSSSAPAIPATPAMSEHTAPPILPPAETKSRSREESERQRALYAMQNETPDEDPAIVKMLVETRRDDNRFYDMQIGIRQVFNANSRYFINEDRHITKVQIIGQYFGDEQFAMICELQHLATLEAYAVLISNAGLRPLLKLSSQLQELRLDGCTISDDAIETLSQMKSLKLLTLTKTVITEDGHQRIQEALPTTKVYWGPRPTE